MSKKCKKTCVCQKKVVLLHSIYKIEYYAETKFVLWTAF